MQLPVAHVDRDHARDAVLEQVVREAAGRGSDVDGVASVQLELELLEGVRELLAATRDEARRPLHVEVDVLGDLVPGLVVAGDETGEDECLRLRAALGEPALDEHDVEALPHRGKGSHGWCNKNVMELQGDRVVLRPLAEADVPAIVELGADPEVERWWRGLTPEHVGEKARGDDDGVVVFAIVVDGGVAGMIQHYEETDEEFRHAGIDLFLGAPYQGRGLGTDAVRTMARHLIDDLGHHRLVIDPAAHNDRAIRCYEKVGFNRVGVLRQYWLDGDGVWRDGVLLDLLAGELT
jgi:aminoglycoside 6'-N-acetyltransferase